MLSYCNLIDSSIEMSESTLPLRQHEPVMPQKRGDAEIRTPSVPGAVKQVQRCCLWKDLLISTCWCIELSDFQKLVWEGHQTPWSYPGIWCAASSLEAGHSKESAGWTTVAYIVPQLKVTGGTSERIYLGFATSGWIDTDKGKVRRAGVEIWSLDWLASFPVVKGW